MTPDDAATAQANVDKVRRAYRVRFVRVVPSFLSPNLVRIRIGKGAFNLYTVSEALHVLRLAKRRERIKQKGKRRNAK